MLKFLYPIFDYTNSYLLFNPAGCNPHLMLSTYAPCSEILGTPEHRHTQLIDSENWARITG